MRYNLPNEQLKGAKQKIKIKNQVKNSVKFVLA